MNSPIRLAFLMAFSARSKASLKAGFSRWLLVFGLFIAGMGGGSSPGTCNQ